MLSVGFVLVFLAENSKAALARPIVILAETKMMLFFTLLPLAWDVLSLSTLNGFGHSPRLPAMTRMGPHKSLETVECAICNGRITLRQKWLRRGIQGITFVCWLIGVRGPRVLADATTFFP